MLKEEAQDSVDRKKKQDGKSGDTILVALGDNHFWS